MNISRQPMGKIKAIDSDGSVWIDVTEYFNSLSSTGGEVVDLSDLTTSPIVIMGEVENVDIDALMELLGVKRPNIIQRIIRRFRR